jgi:hypothetical protein
MRPSQKANSVLLAKTKLFVIEINELLYHNSLHWRNPTLFIGAFRRSFVAPAGTRDNLKSAFGDRGTGS